MKIKFLSGPRKGEISHAPRSQETDLLINAGVIEKVPDDPIVATSTWSVARGANNGRYYILGTCSLNGEVFRYDGPADGVKRYKFIHSCGGSMPVDVPDEIVEKYRAIKQGEQPILGVDEIAMYSHVHTAYPSEKKKL